MVGMPLSVAAACTDFQRFFAVHREYFRDVLHHVLGWGAAFGERDFRSALYWSCAVLKNGMF
jgi:hypothetical protein